MSNDIEDIMINTQVYGIYNPKNFHSFQNTWGIVFLQVCQSCNTRILPLSPACECLRCGCLAHRKCIQNFPNCSHFTFEKSPSHIDGKGDSQSPKKSRSKSRRQSAVESLPPSDKTANDIHFDSIFELRLEEIIEKACSIPAVLGYIPKIKSPFCIWRTLLRAIVMRQTTDLDRISPFCSSDDSSTTIESKVRACLNDLDGFTGQVFVCCFYVFLSLNVLDTMELAIQHGRECIDTIVDGLLCVCDEEVSLDARMVRSIVVAVEKFVLHEQNGAFYEKMFQFIVRKSSAIIMNDNFRDAHRWLEKNWKEFNKYATAIRMKHSPKEKLMILVVFLQLISETTAANSEAQLSSHRESMVSQLYLSPAQEDDKRVVDDSLSLRPADIDAELQSIQENFQSLKREDINADKLIELLGCIIHRQQEEGVCNWFAEYLFLSSDLVSNDSVDTMAAEGYALATLQQCISIMTQKD